MLVWQKTFQPDFVCPVVKFMNDSSQYRDVDICCFKPVSVLAIWGKLRPFLLFLEITHPCRKHLYNDLNHFQSIIFVFNSASRSYCLRDWPLYHTRCCIRKKKPTFENNDLSARGDFSVNPATFYHSLGILVLIAQFNFCAQPVNQIYEVKYCILPRTSL